jgi:ATP-dependent Clp protease protease subunit
MTKLLLPKLLLSNPHPGFAYYNKLQLPKAQALPLPQGVSFDEVSPSALARWNANLAAKEDGGEDEASISIYDAIGYSWDGTGVTAKRISAALRAIGKKENVTVNINSPGGDLFEGIAIYNVLRDHQGEVTTRVIGLAASAASLIAMAGDKIQVARASFMMIHNVWVMAVGNRNDLRDAADQLEAFDDALAGIYVARTGKQKAAVAKMMDKETWFMGEKAIEEGFADELLPADVVEEKKDTDAEASNSLRWVDTVLARAGIPRSQRRAALNSIKGATPDAGTQERGTQDAAADATQDAGAQVQSMIEYLKSI